MQTTFSRQVRAAVFASLDRFLNRKNVDGSSAGGAKVVERGGSRKEEAGIREGRPAQVWTSGHTRWILLSGIVVVRSF